MRKAYFGEGGNVEAVMDDNLQWHCSIAQLEESLTRFSKWRREEISPANGNPLSVVFSDIAKQFNAVRIVDTYEPEEHKGRVY